MVKDKKFVNWNKQLMMNITYPKRTALMENMKLNQ